VLVLFGLSILATAYHLITGASVQRAESVMQDNRYKSLQIQIDDATKAIAQAQADKAACPANYLTNCIKPAQARVDAATQTRADLLKEQAGIQPASGGAAFWQRMASGTDTDGQGLETAFAFLRGILLEILGLMLVAQAGAGFRMQRGQSVSNGYAVAIEKAPQPAAIGQAPENAQIPAQRSIAAVPSLDTGGRVVSDGLAKIHAGEAVLNPHATAELDRLHPGLVDSLNKAGRDKIGTGRPASGPADGDCVTAAIYAAFLSGALSPSASRETVREYIKKEGHTISNERLAKCRKVAIEQWKTSNTK
jgi:hypothetical protein